MQIDKKNLLLKDLPSIRQMLAFIKVYEDGHMSAAADELSLTQPAVTVLIKELEQKLNVQLFDRATRTLKPTQSADLILPYIKRSLAELNELNTVIKDLNDLKTGSMSIAITPNSSQNLLTKLLTGFVEKYPEIKIHILESEPLELMSTLLNGKSDLCIGILEKELPFIQAHSMMQDAIVAIYHPDYPVISPCASWEHMLLQNLILTHRGYGIRHKIDQQLDLYSSTIPSKIVQEVSLINTVISLVQAGLGVGLVPLTSVADRASNLIIQELNHPKITREISLFHLKDKSLNPATREFIKHCQSLTL